MEMILPPNTTSDAVGENGPTFDRAHDDADEAIDYDLASLADGPADAADSRGYKFRAVAKRVVVFGLLPLAALMLATGCAWLKWWDGGNRADRAASAESVQAATEITVALLSYQPDTVDKDLGSARDRLTGAFRDSYASLINDVVIPGAKQKHISAVATVPAAASVSATRSHAVVLVMVNQTTAIGTDPPTQTNSSIKVTLDKVEGRWLISDFTPI